MAKFRYKGNRSDFNMMGLTFRIEGENQDPETEDEHIIKKLRYNTHFEELDVAPKTSTGMNVGPAVEIINGLETLEELKAFAAEDERPGVVKAADAKAEALQANNE